MIKTYEDFKVEVYKMSKIDLNSYKEKQMKRRIDSLIDKNKYSDYESYVQALKKDKAIYEEFINYLTINVSEFYRNPAQWEVFEREILQEALKHSSNITIWSAACSTGDEPYTIAMVMSKYMPLSKVKVIATDIDMQVLEKAKMGLYNEKSLAGLPLEFKTKYFNKVGSSYQISEELKRCVTFKQHNLLSDAYPSNCDIIVCRNVLIYFTEEAKEEIFKKFNKALKVGGTLFVGSTEQIIMPQRYQLTPSRTFFYRKEAEIK